PRNWAVNSVALGSCSLTNTQAGGGGGGPSSWSPSPEHPAMAPASMRMSSQLTPHLRLCVMALPPARMRCMPSMRSVEGHSIIENEEKSAQRAAGAPTRAWRLLIENQTGKFAYHCSRALVSYGPYS